MIKITKIMWKKLSEVVFFLTVSVFLLTVSPSFLSGQEKQVSSETNKVTLKPQAGMTPENYEGFEQGHFELFAPTYIGDSKKWIRPTAKVVETNPIAGNHSLHWQANQQEQEWVLASNAFYIDSPFTYSAKFRVESSGSGDYGIGIAAMKSKHEVTALRLDGSDAYLDQSEWYGNESGKKEFRLTPGTVYTLQLKLDDTGHIQAKVLNESGEKSLLHMKGQTSIKPTAIGLYVSTRAGANTSIFFDDVKIDSGPYRIKAEEWVRAPQPLALPRTPEMAPDQGNWVGGMTVREIDNEYLMWYRIRDNEQRGGGYGLARSKDGLSWKKYDSNPVLTFGSEFDSNEKISVLKVDSLYQAWYALDTGSSWIIAYATSKDGTHWKEHGKVIEGYSKDADVVYVEGTYYLYAIAPTKNDISIYTSVDGVDWKLRNTIAMGAHRHPAVYYVDQDREFRLYAFGGGKGVSVASSTDGIHFKSFQEVWHPPAIGLDDWQQWGIDYGAFPTDRWGHLQQDENLIMYYQARHAYDNNHGTWKYHGDGKILTAGNFSDLFVGVPVSILPKNPYRYHAFPFHARQADGLAVTSSGSIDFIVNGWDRSADTVAEGTLHSKENTHVRLAISGLKSSKNYRFSHGKNVTQNQTNKEGNIIFLVDLKADQKVDFTIEVSN